MPHNFSTKFIKKLPEKVRKVGTTNYKFFMHLQEVELCDGFHLKSVVQNPKVLIRPHEKARQQRQTLIWWKPRPLAFHEVNCVNSGKTRQKEVVELFSENCSQKKRQTFIWWKRRPLAFRLQLPFDEFFTVIYAGFGN